MFGIGLGEIVLIILLLIIFIKPEDLPKFFRTMGKIYGEAKKAYNEVISVKDQIIKEIDDAASIDDLTIKKTALPSPIPAHAGEKQPPVVQTAVVPAPVADPAAADTAPEPADKP
jgi:sec-independent protein translocase protein TatB